MNLEDRKIIHVDMDAFYASVEQLDAPELKGKPLAVGGSSKRGVVAAASYEARKYGVRSAMPSVTAARLCPDLIFVKARFERYREVSQQIREIFLDYTDLVEPLSLDEAYLDVTENKLNYPSATIIAYDIRRRIYETTGLTASAGISVNKFIAKVASDYNKPNGQKTITPDEVLEFLEELEIRKFHGIGKVTAEKMYQHGIFNGADLKLKTKEFLAEHYGKSGLHYYNIVRGIHKSAVKPDRIRKSLGAERTFSDNISSEIFMMERLNQIAEEIERRLAKNNVAGKTVTLKIKYSDFKMQTRSKTIANYINKKEEILEIATELVRQESFRESVRLLGLSLSNLNTEDKEEEEPVEVQLEFEF
ncbi:DNA polymerase-4 [Nonlabens sp. Hel1_33_55]|uniref:DNA polymerase IV n=1 Tax=Nonlabens sp. Hel1_33_55 TaxID=1336802 RepID=UPI000875B00B|nr:DNA polymerase IV [Nonlabens sp. Hel1_33_55]SCY29220.1 DNA polymerase-4 [Nonlabens sp. Hel1_33_55]